MGQLMNWGAYSIEKKLVVVRSRMKLNAMIVLENVKLS